MIRQIHTCAALAFLMLAAASPAQIAVSANDGKARPAAEPDAPRTADSIAVLDLGRTPVRQLATLPVPGSVVGPPSGVALTRDSRLAIVAAAQTLDAEGKPAHADIVSVIDLSRPAAPRLVQTAHAGAGAAGVAINPAGTLVLVANMEADSVSVFALANRRLTPLDTIRFDPKTRPADVGFAPDGRTAYVVAMGISRLLPLAVAGQRLTRAGDGIAIGPQPYSLTISPKGDRAYVSHLGGRAPSATRGPKPGAIGIVDLAAGRMIDQVDTGITPEHIGLSPSGRYLAAVVQNGSTAPKDSPAYKDYGLLVVFRTGASGLVPVAEARTGAWCQGAAWRTDETMVMVQCSAAKQIEAFRFDGKALQADPASLIQLDARPGAIATARHN
jgi:DNA-binding beta-propeller fold protein YncE